MPKTYQVKAPSQIHWCRHHPKPHIQKNVSTNDPNRPSERCVHAGKRSKHSGHPNVYDTTRTHGQISTQHVHDLVKCPILNFCMRLFSAAKNKRRPARPSTHLQSTIHGRVPIPNLHKLMPTHNVWKTHHYEMDKSMR